MARRCPTAAAAAAQGLPDARRRGQKLLDEALLRGHCFPDAHLDVIMPTLLAGETFVLVDHD